MEGGYSNHLLLHQYKGILDAHQIAYYEVDPRGITKTDLLRTESVAILCLLVEGLELENRYL